MEFLLIWYTVDLEGLVGHKHTWFVGVGERGIGSNLFSPIRDTKVGRH